MKALQKTLLTLALTVFFLDLLNQLGSLGLPNSSPNRLPTFNWSFHWSYLLAFLIGLLLSAIIWSLEVHRTAIGISFIWTSVIYGCHTLFSSPEARLVLNWFHGIAVFINVTLLFLVLAESTKRTDFRSELCQIGSFLIIPGVCILMAAPWLSSLLNNQWNLYGLIFLYAFTGALLLFLAGYWNHPTLKIKLSSSKINFNTVGLSLLAVITATFTLGFLYQHLILEAKESLWANFYAFLFLSILGLSLNTRLGRIAEIIGNSKGILMGFLLLAFSLSLFTLSGSPYFKLIPTGLVGAAYGLLIPCLYDSLWDFFSSSYRVIFIGVFHLLTPLGGLLGLVSAKTIEVSLFSPYLFSCLIVISVCIPYIRKIHQEAVLYQ